MTDTASRLESVRQRIREAERIYGREPGSASLLAVSKSKSAEAVRVAHEAGQRCFGESYLQEAREKIAALAQCDLEWHFIGPVQSNKARPIAAAFDWVHSVDRLKVAERLSEYRPAELAALNVCLQVNVSEEASKSGVSFAQLPALAEQVAALPRLRLRGLMAIPAPSEGLAAQRRSYRPLREAMDRLVAAGLMLDTLSMGMSADLQAAIAEGATIVRVGTDIFGPRTSRDGGAPAP
jgi:pyridoxal phosphate enzyme (YggS family)